ncbi:histidine phosphatase family protein [Pseudomonas benzenivorans]|uniref:Histidine phosphatase family protein n=1 Tax=Pseudomonas benzenivorans TaxID=556533 RepID=A0ABY5H8F2_9PSED|nr:histidine phosphatase family protein [Pseudomonas benzenivorans]UTW08294.1 histidine phosphatase family protein [Pseudomonas benzenivorans]
MPDRFVACLLLAWLALPGAAQASEREAWDALREGRAVLLLRHATAPGMGDPANFRLGDCSTQRNLDQRGRDEARRWGQLLRNQGISRPRLLSSRWCRARDTAQQMDLGPVEPLPALDSFFAARARAKAQTAELVERVNALMPGTVMVLVSHQVNITALTGVYPASGEGLILARPLVLPAQVLARIPPP